MEVSQEVGQGTSSLSIEVAMPTSWGGIICRRFFSQCTIDLKCDWCIHPFIAYHFPSTPCTSLCPFSQPSNGSLLSLLVPHFPSTLWSHCTSWGYGKQWLESHTDIGRFSQHKAIEQYVKRGTMAMCTYCVGCGGVPRKKVDFKVLVQEDCSCQLCKPIMGDKEKK